MAEELVLLTGSTGMVGFRTLVYVLKKGYRVRVAVRNQAGLDKIKSLPPVAPYLSQIESVFVPDITIPDAYDEAVKGVTYVIHIAAPLANAWFTDFENEVIKPSIQGTVGMLSSASKVSGIKKIVITGSAASVIEAKYILSEETDQTFNEKSIAPPPSGPYANVYDAYMSSKALAYHASQAYIHDNKPSYDVITIGPGFILGRDDTVTEASGITKGTNGFLMSQLLGQPLPGAASLYAHLDDVAWLHVESLRPSITGNKFFPVSTSDAAWADALDIVKKAYPKAVAEGVFKVDKGTPTLRVRFDASYTEKTFGFKFHTYEDMVLSVTGHYLELLGKKAE